MSDAHLTLPDPILSFTPHLIKGELTFVLIVTLAVP
jgi:hypothetical protein